MGEEKYDLNNTSKNTFNIKLEFEDNNHLDNKVFVFEKITVERNDTEVKGIAKEYKFKPGEIFIADGNTEELPSSEIDYIKVKYEDSAISNIKLESDNKLLFCEDCHVYYEDYCTTCQMLVCVLNNTISDNACEDIPKAILEIKELLGQFGIFALKVIPENVRFGPFTGLRSSNCSWKLKGGKIVISEDKSKLQNWMQYVNPARYIYEKNLLSFQYEDNIYYRTTCEIQAGEELLVYFSDENEDCSNKDVEIHFVPIIEKDVKSVFACTFCCLGFSSKLHLAKHKTVCFRETSGKFSSIEELAQCSSCKIYLHEKEYLEYHMTCCPERRIRLSQL